MVRLAIFIFLCCCGGPFVKDPAYVYFKFKDHQKSQRVVKEKILKVWKIQLRWIHGCHDIPQIRLHGGINPSLKFDNNRVKHNSSNFWIANIILNVQKEIVLCLSLHYRVTYLEPTGKCKMELIAKTVNGLKPLTIFKIIVNLDFRLGI